MNRLLAHGVLFSLFVSCLSAAMPARGDVFTNVAEATDDGYQLMYQLAIPNSANFSGGTPVPYSVNNAGSVVKGPGASFDRVAYYLELDTGSGLQWVYASMDKVPGMTVHNIGVPHNINNPVVWQRTVNNMNVASNVPSIVTGTGITTGNVEIWPSSYNNGNGLGLPGAVNGLYDFDDVVTGMPGYGSFQVHNQGANQTLLAYNGWGAANPDDVGIGTNNYAATPNTNDHPDWTFSGNAGSYTVKNLQILVRPASEALEQAPAGIVANAPEASTFNVVYALPVQSAAFNASQYTSDNSMAFADGSFERVAYYMELRTAGGETQFAYVSMDPFTNDASKLGVPKNNVFEMNVNNMNVVSNVAGVVNGTGIATGNIEFWPTSYSAGPNSNLGGNTNDYDFDDTRNTGGTYGSMQIHNHGGSTPHTIMAYNYWTADNGELGIGNQPTGHPDWTFSNNSGTYTIKNIWVLADLAGEVLTATAGGSSTVDFGTIPYSTSVTLTDVVTLQNTGVTNSLIDVQGFSITGDDASLFDVPDFAQALLQAGWSDTAMFEVEFLGAPQGNYSALLTFDTSSGPASFNLMVSVVPEPATWLLGLVAGVALLIVRRPGRNRRSPGTSSPSSPIG